MADKTMKILVIGGNLYEIVDEKARADIETLKDANTIDTTLSHSGQAADAKSVGDAIKQINIDKANVDYVNEQLTLKVSKSRTINGKSLDEDIVLKPEDIGVITDTTLTKEGVAADAKSTGNAINQVSSNLSSKIDNDINHLYSEVGTSINALSSSVDNKINQLSSNVENDINQLSTKIDNSINALVVELPINGWESTENTDYADIYSYIQNVTVEGVTSDNIVIVGAHYEDIQIFSKYRIICISQTNNTLTFKCDSLPTKDVLANVIILQ